ncbi:hypothetical protein [Paraferrimonas sedimenticola]|uniref:MetA-pathway of phenol degradation n=1 Tax=Paraferrimonas sedimenticola TaxID=375674 RepID=A0AA37RVA6_9GAMM|nr:hypothetical protein [Paraferrimonas sedimenticola]GLP95703.1 hypothetical protein GCM10007895_10090 [Paraferrimonas sedimenticola]
MKLNTVSTKLIALGLFATAATAVNAAEQKEEQVNYGSPTAIYTSGGVSLADGHVQGNFNIGAGQHMFFADVGHKKTANPATGKSEHNIDYRARYFFLTESGKAGLSIESLGDNFSNTTMAGGLLAFNLTDAISIYPMAYVGKQTNKYAVTLEDGTSFKDSNVANVGLYAMYAFEAGHWLYANPRAMYVQEAKETVPQLEAGLGYMVRDNMSVGLRVTTVGATKISQKDTAVAAQFSVYF